MRIPPPNPLTTVCIWIGAIFIAIREGAATVPSLSGLAAAMSGVWNYLPLGVLVFAAVVYVARLFLPARPHPQAITFVGAKAEPKADLAAELAALKKRLEPRRLTYDQRVKLRNGLRGHGSRVQIMFVMNMTDGADYAHDFAETFEQAGWTSDCVQLFAGPKASRHGLSLVTQDLSQLNLAQEGVAEALDQAGLHYDLEHAEMPANYDVRLIISAKPS